MEILLLLIIFVVISAMWAYYYVSYVRQPQHETAGPISPTTGSLIEFPAEPKVFTNEDLAAQSGVLVRSVTYHLDYHNTYYFLQHIQFPSAAKFQGKEKQLLDRLAEDSAKLLQAQITWKNTTTFRGLPALNFKVERTSGNYTNWRCTNLLIGTEVYAIKMAWRGEIDEPAFQRFVHSFRIPG